MVVKHHFLLVLLGLILFCVLGEPPIGLEQAPYNLFVIFIATIVGIIAGVMPMGAMAFMAMTLLVLTKTLTLANVLSGFASPIIWLVVLAFFVSRGFIKTKLGNRIAYWLLSKFGASPIGLAYSLIFTEFFLSPLIPSATARGGGVIYPIASAINSQFADPKGKGASSLIIICFFTNVITSALFLTSMASNPLVASMAAGVGIEISWERWATVAVVPGICNLLLLPYMVRFFMRPSPSDHPANIVAMASKEYKALGGLKINEIIMLIAFVLMVLLWVLGPIVGIDATTAALIGFMLLIVGKVLTWEDVVTEKGAWETMLWFAVLIMMAEFLTKLGFTKWAEAMVQQSIVGIDAVLLVIILSLLFYYVHYFFASITTHMTVLFIPVLMIFLSVGMPAELSVFILAVSGVLSAGLTHYGISTAPIYFSSGHFSIKEWWKLGFFISTINALIWMLSAGLWWKILQLW